MLRSPLTVLTFLAALLAGGPAEAQTSEYFMMAGDEATFIVVRNGEIQRTWSPAAGTDDYQYPIVVTTTVRTMGADPGDIGAEYDLDGNDLGPRFTHPANPPSRSWDGTTDGTFYYTIDLSGEVWRLDSDWGNPVSAFDPGGLGGITYDPTDDTMWVTAFSSDLVEHYEMDGTLIGSFSTGHTQNMAIALDHADGTLWLHDRTTQGTIEQWSKAGALLDRITVPGLDAYNALGGEMAFPSVTCDEDLNGDGFVNVADLLAVLTNWGTPDGDVTGDGMTNVQDLLAVLAAFGPC